MPRYRYHAIDTSGRKINGVLDEPDEGRVRATLESYGLSPVKVVDAAAAGFRLPSLGARVGMKTVLEFTDQLYSLLQAGLPLDRALQVLMSSMENRAMQEVLKGLYLEVEKGHSLADAFSQYPRVFPRIYVNMIRAGEEGGILPVVLERLIEFYERSIEFRSFLITSSVYPVLLFFFGIAAMVVLTVVVIPKFGEIFTDMGQELPTAAAVLVGTSDFLVQYGLFILAGLALAGGLFWWLVSTPGGRRWWHGTLLGLPGIGRLILRIQLARVTRTLGTLLASGVPILNSIRIVQGLTDNIPLKDALERLMQSVREGKGVARPLKADRFFPPLLGHLATVGEESGALDRMLLKVADQYDSEVRKVTKTFVSLFEPIMIIGMGGMIGTMVVSMLTAIFSINDMPL